MGLISCAKKYPVSTFHPKNPALQDSQTVDKVRGSRLGFFYIKDPESPLFSGLSGSFLV